MNDIQKLGAVLGSFACMLCELEAMRQANKEAERVGMQPPHPAEAFKRLPDKHCLTDVVNFMTK